MLLPAHQQQEMIALRLIVLMDVLDYAMVIALACAKVDVPLIAVIHARAVATVNVKDVEMLVPKDATPGVLVLVVQVAPLVVRPAVQENVILDVLEAVVQVVLEIAVMLVLEIVLADVKETVERDAQESAQEIVEMDAQQIVDRDIVQILAQGLVLADAQEHAKDVQIHV